MEWVTGFQFLLLFSLLLHIFVPKTFFFFLHHFFFLFSNGRNRLRDEESSCKANANPFPREASITVKNRVRTTREKKKKNPKLFFVKSKKKKKKKNIFLFFVMILVRQQSLMISTKEFHQQIESLAVSFAFDGQHIFANLTGAFQFGYPEQKFSKLRRHVWIVRKRVLLQGFEH